MARAIGNDARSVFPHARPPLALTGEEIADARRRAAGDARWISRLRFFNLVRARSHMCTHTRESMKGSFSAA